MQSMYSLVELGGVGDDEAVAEDDGAAGVAGDVLVVGDEDDGDALLLVELPEEADDLAAGAAVEVASGLVAHEDVGVVDQGPGDGDTLLLTAGELAGMVMQAVGEADERQFVLGALTALAKGDAAGVEERELDVFERRSASQQIEILKDEAETVIADAGSLVTRHVGDFFAGQAVAAAGGAVEAAEHVHEGGFSGAGRAHKGYVFAFFDVEGGGAEGFDLDLAEVVDFPDIAELDERHEFQTVTSASG